MKHRKVNMFRLLGLSAILLLACVVTLVGVSYARYQVDTSETFALTPREPENIHLGILERETEDAEGTFVPNAQGIWELEDDDDTLQLAFAVSNGTDSETFAESDQEFRVRLVASMGAWDGADTAKVVLRIPSIPSEADPEKPLEIPGEAKRIREGSILYDTFGEGWVFSFYDPWNEEWRFDLNGGEWNSLELVLIVDEVGLADPTLLQLQITGYFASN